MMKKRLANTCPVCHGNHLMHMCTYNGMGGDGNTYEVMQCSDCHLHIIAPAREAAPALQPTAGIEAALYAQLQNRLLGQKLRTVEREAHRVSGVLLDVGCGEGNFIAHMRRNGWIAHGIEPCAAAREKGNERYNLNIEQGNTLYSLRAHSYNVVTAWNALGRYASPHDAFAALAGLITRDGTLILAHYNPLSHVARHYGNLWFAATAQGSFQFSPRAIELLCEAHNMVIVGRHTSRLMSLAAATACETVAGNKRPWWSGAHNGMTAHNKAKDTPDEGCYIIYTIKNNPTQ